MCWNLVRRAVHCSFVMMAPTYHLLKSNRLHRTSAQIHKQMIWIGLVQEISITLTFIFVSMADKFLFYAKQKFYFSLWCIECIQMISNEIRINVEKRHRKKNISLINRRLIHWKRHLSSTFAEMSQYPLGVSPFSNRFNLLIKRWVETAEQSTV